MSPPRVLLAKPGLDGHDRGIKVIAMALRDAGVEVIYLGLRRSAPEIARAALDDDVDAIGISVLSGAHLALGRELLDELRAQGVSAPVAIGGTIPAADVDALLEIGVARVCPVGTALPQVVADLLDLAGARAERAAG